MSGVPNQASCLCRHRSGHDRNAIRDPRSQRGSPAARHSAAPGRQGQRPIASEGFRRMRPTSTGMSMTGIDPVGPRWLRSFSPSGVLLELMWLQAGSGHAEGTRANRQSCPARDLSWRARPRAASPLASAGARPIRSPQWPHARSRQQEHPRQPRRFLSRRGVGPSRPRTPAARSSR